MASSDELSIEELRDLIKSACTELDDVTAGEIASKLHGRGLTKQRRLCKARESDLTESGLNAFQALDVLEFFLSQSGKNNIFICNTRKTVMHYHIAQLLFMLSQTYFRRINENYSLLKKVGSSKLNVHLPGGSTAETQRRTANEEEAGPSNVGQVQFKLDWKRVYNCRAGVREKLKKGLRLDPEDRRKVVAEIVDQVCQKIPRANRATYETIYRDHLLPKYKTSFEEVLGAYGAEVKTTGGILKQLKDKHDNNKRPNRKVQLTVQERETPRCKAAVGCIRWRMVNYPEGETEETLQGKKEELKTMYSTVRPQHFDVDKIKTNMTLTYKLQREMINANMEKAMEEQRLKQQRGKRQKQEEDPDNPEDVVNIQDVRDEFPFLFTNNGMSLHYQMLVGINVQESLQKFVDTELNLFVEYFTSLAKPEILSQVRKMNRALKMEGADSAYCKFLGFLRMLTLSLNEDFDQMVSLVEVRSSDK